MLVSLDGGIPPVAEQCPSLSDLYDEEWLSSLVTVTVIHAESAFNWKIQVENFAESYHHAGVHPETLQPIFPGQRSFVLETGDEPSCSIDHVSVVDGIEPFTVTVVFPHLLFSWTRPDVVVWFDIRPVSVDRTALDIRILAEPGDDRAGLEQFAATLREINDEDAPINERTQAGLASRFSRPGRLSHLEEATWQFRSWLLEQLGTA